MIFLPMIGAAFSPITLLLAAALIPGIFLMYKVYKMDAIEKEPAGLLLKVFIAGALTVISASILETIGYAILNAFFSEYTIGYMILENFIIVGIAEEGGKYLVLKKMTWNNTNFDYCFDGIVYAVFTGLGFAVVENVMYVFEYGLSTALVRAVTAVPAHTIFAIFMGYYYGKAKLAEVRGYEAASARYRRFALLVPVLLHGFYDFTASIDSGIFALLFWVFIFGLEFIAYRKIKHYAAEDEGFYY